MSSRSIETIEIADGHQVKSNEIAEMFTLNSSDNVGIKINFFLMAEEQEWAREFEIKIKKTASAEHNKR